MPALHHATPVPPDKRFSRELENHASTVALYFMYYNVGRVHQTLRVTPAMEASIATHVWSIEEIIGLWSIAHDVGDGPS